LHVEDASVDTATAATQAAEEEEAALRIQRIARGKASRDAAVEAARETAPTHAPQLSSSLPSKEADVDATEGQVSPRRVAAAWLVSRSDPRLSKSGQLLTRHQPIMKTHVISNTPYEQSFLTSNDRAMKASAARSAAKAKMVRAAAAAGKLETMVGQPLGDITESDTSTSAWTSRSHTPLLGCSPHGMGAPDLHLYMHTQTRAGKDDGSLAANAAALQLSLLAIEQVQGEMPRMNTRKLVRRAYEAEKLVTKPLNAPPSGKRVRTARQKSGGRTRKPGADIVSVGLLRGDIHSSGTGTPLDEGSEVSSDWNSSEYGGFASGSLRGRVLRLKRRVLSA